MRLTNRTPFLAGYKVGSRSPPRPDLTIVVRAAFVLSPRAPLRAPGGIPLLGQGRLTADVFGDGDDERVGACVYPSDFADYKLKTDLLLRGTCYAPGGEPTTECPVRFSVGAWSKVLHVSGPRVWDGDEPGAPAPFTRVPLTFESAFGGPSFPANPVGVGLGTRELPAVELPHQRVRTRRDRPAPGCFGPINPAWLQRASKLGREYGESWRRGRSPFYAEDFDGSYFNAAPADQQLDAPLRGDEELSFHNLHPDAARFTTRLPAIRIRAFVHDASGWFREVKMAIDTLFADVDAGRLWLTFRGVEPVSSDDLSDVKTALVASEPLASEPLPEAHYRAALEAFERDPAGLESAVAEPLRGVAAQVLGKPTGVAPPARPDVDPLSAVVAQKLGSVAAPEQRRLRAAMEAARGAPLPPGVDLDALLREAVSAAPKPPVAPPAFAPDSPPRAPIGARMRPILERIDLARRASAPRTATPTESDPFAPLDALASDPRLRDPEPRIASPGSGPDLSGQDLGGRDLRGADLRGANLQDTNLAGADLAGAQLAGAKLMRAILAGANLEGANLEGADLTSANLSKTRAPMADLRRAVLDKINAPGAIFTRASLIEAKAEGAIFQDAELDGADVRRAAFTEAVFDGASFAGADLSSARLIRCRLYRARAAKARFSRAVLLGTSFADADLADALFVEAQGRGADFLRASLVRADLSYALFPEAHFSEADASAARFRCADLAHARFYRASLDGADLTSANLLHADLRKARLAAVRFGGGNLYHADLTGAAVERCDFTGANLRRSSIEPAGT